MLKTTALLALMIATPASAQTLWQNVNMGMTKEQVSALYPDAKVKSDKIEISGFQPLPGCKSKVEIDFKSGAVDRVRVKGGASIGGSCADKVFVALAAKYGEPMAKETQSTLFDSHDTAVWTKDGITMRFRRPESPDLSKPSWEMVYSTAGAEIAL